MHMNVEIKVIIKKQITTQNLSLPCTDCHPQNNEAIVHNSRAVRGKFCCGTFKNYLRVPKCDHADDAIFAWMYVGDDSCRPMEGCRIVLPQ